MLERVREDMDVYDSTGEKIGEVSYVRFGGDIPGTPESEVATASVPEQEDSLVEDLAEAFRVDTIPEEMKERLLVNGFIRVDEGILQSDAYILPTQIASIGEDRVNLNVTEDKVFQA